jgi:hypothetical protein
MPKVLALAIRLMIMVAFAAPTSRATMVIVLITNDGYWVAADGLKSHGFGKISVCKIHETKFGILAKSGDAQGFTESGIDYSTNKLVEDLLESSASSEEFRAAVRQRYMDDIVHELVYLYNDPQMTSANIGRFAAGGDISAPMKAMLSRTLVLLETTNQNSQMRVLNVLPKSVPVNTLNFFPRYRYSAEANPDWDDVRHIYMRPVDSARTPYPPSVHLFAITIVYEKSDAWVQLHPKDALLEMLKKGTTEHSDSIGPPYSIVHVILAPNDRPSKRKSQIIWIEHGKCPYWDESIDTKNTTRQYRNARKAGSPTLP